MMSTTLWNLQKEEVVGCKWNYKRKVKADIDGSMERLVAQEYSQVFGQDYGETFCAVVCFESLRSLIAIATQDDPLYHQLNITAAFLNTLNTGSHFSGSK